MKNNSPNSIRLAMKASATGTLLKWYDLSGELPKNESWQKTEQELIDEEVARRLKGLTIF